MTDQEFQERVLARIDSMQEDISWIRGNLEGKQEAAVAFCGKIAIFDCCLVYNHFDPGVLQIRRLDVGL